MICIYQVKEQFVHYWFSNRVREEQCVLLERLYLQMTLVVYIFTYIYIYIFVYISSHVDGKVEAYITCNIKLNNIKERFILINKN
jgi:hypothetical protein